jgi:hypothetical protein
MRATLVPRNTSPCVDWRLAKIETTGSVAEKRLLEAVKSQNPHATRAELAHIFTVRRC